jgi:hypothetical protein
MITFVSLFCPESKLGLPTPFLFHGREDFGKVIDTEGRVLEPLECGDHCILQETLVGIKNEGLLRVSDSMPITLKGGRSKASRTRPSVSWKREVFFWKPLTSGIPWKGIIPAAQDHAFFQWWNVIVWSGCHPAWALDRGEAGSSRVCSVKNYGSSGAFQKRGLKISNLWDELLA